MNFENNPFLPQFISEEAYSYLHQNGNRKCFDYTFSHDQLLTYRLLDGDIYETEADGETIKNEFTSYILIIFDEHDDTKEYIQINLKQAFELLALFNSVNLYGAVDERTFFDEIVSIVQEAERNGGDSE